MKALHHDNDNEPLRLRPGSYGYRGFFVPYRGGHMDLRRRTVGGINKPLKPRPLDSKYPYVYVLFTHTERGYHEV